MAGENALGRALADLYSGSVFLDKTPEQWLQKSK